MLFAQDNPLLPVRTLPNQSYIRCRAQSRFNDSMHLKMIVNKDNENEGVFSLFLDHKEVPSFDRVFIWGSGAPWSDSIFPVYNTEIDQKKLSFVKGEWLN
jgi:hypothetical protein